jgi:hypothetical protein
MICGFTESKLAGRTTFAGCDGTAVKNVCPSFAEVTELPLEVAAALGAAAAVGDLLLLEAAAEAEAGAAAAAEEADAGAAAVRADAGMTVSKLSGKVALLFSASK